ncbi:MAG TPA: helix-turn-helix transcriptional regulator [Mucilaginibacter sp.]|jgi:AraC-like DNA-binding protein|nr:helix-turn-helix transcriptional regulator [Mucilaginibacter sp.]
MKYTEFTPHPALAPYIDAYWTATGDATGMRTEKILPDGCIDIIFNLGPDCLSENNTFLLNSGQAYLIGTMTQFKETLMTPETRLLGIRFKPAAFTVFYEYPSLEKLTDTTVALDKKLAPDIKSAANYPIAYLDHFFLKKLSKPKRSILPIISGIQESKGQLSVKMLAEKYFTTTRQLERAFNQQMGISPKEFINLVRYQTTFREIKNNHTQKSLLQIAFECGYYDHSHLSNEIKRYTGLAPAQL